MMHRINYYLEGTPINGASFFRWNPKFWKNPRQFL